ncbi:BSP-domain-containing protein, partial [Pleomassaria siparia CBS 279.74]
YFQTMTPAPTTDPTPTNTPAAPQPSALPPPSEPSSSGPPTWKSTISQPPASEGTIPIPHRKPLLRLELRDLSSAGSQAFLRLLHASYALEDAVNSVLRLLYTGLDTDCIPPTRSVTLILRSMDGVAYTTGKDLDDDHKEIHFSTDYISQISDTRLKEEMKGVIVHEMVHCWQHNGQGTAPGGLIEGIADWVRLKAGYAPPHWRPHGDCDWDAGYERTGYFLEWLEKKHGPDIVRRINEGLRGCKYEEGEFWDKCCGSSIGKLWKGYQGTLE